MASLASTSALRRGLHLGHSPRPHLAARGFASAADPSQIRPLIASLPSRSRYPYKDPELAVDHLVIGGGVVGLAVASALAARWPEKTTYLVERNRAFGEETSSRNSEVIHAGLYYPADSLKTRMCLRGRELMYQRCQEQQIPHKQTQKLVVGADFAKAYLEKLKSHCDALGDLAPPTKLISGAEARELEPHLSPEIAWALLSQRTGIVSSHELMASLERELLDSENAEVVYDTKVVRVDAHRPAGSSSASGSKRGSDHSQDGWVVQTVTSESGSSSAADSDALLAKVVINSSGLNGPMVLNSLLDTLGSQEEPIPMWHSKGNYASYKGPGATNIKHLIYPVPDTRKGTHAYTSLGTHLTLDLDGNVRFGPDTEWISPPASLSETDGAAVDFWKKGLTVDESRLETMYQQITEYLPNISKDGLSPDYAGIRPKLTGPDQKGFVDFQMLWHNSVDLASQRLWQLPPHFPSPSSSCTSKAKQSVAKVEGGAMLSLVGIESPGLTSSLAIGEFVTDLIAKGFYRDHKTRQPSNKGARNEERADQLDAWA
ncbi:FAD dependent oxidoreductase [Testicularia cyperi]|uniref:L-2-hydroxyglutarate dehydrogenase, mitochondrial n=1 Tax=Testicularia cyperi TaxID=1882483 RepID=A0A317XNK3_9BASI|nr:FAD dependent oxidoreductase [Testicularia cyperi]